MNDNILKHAVEAALEFEPSIDAAEIGVSVNSGIVTLSGQVQSYAQRLDAEKVVKRLKAVRGYVDRLQVALTIDQNSDEMIARRAASLVEWDVTVPEGAVKVAVSNGHVVLSGEVPWQYQRLAAERGIRRLSGVRSVNNVIIVKPVAHASDIKRRIQDALELQADIDASKINISVIGDKVHLAGQVRAWSEREIAEHAAWAAPGVRSVEDHLTISI